MERQAPSCAVARALTVALRWRAIAKAVIEHTHSCLGLHSAPLGPCRKVLERTLAHILTSHRSHRVQRDTRTTSETGPRPPLRGREKTEHLERSGES